VLQVSALDKAGGAEQVAWNLFKGYQASQINSWLAVGKKRSNDPNVSHLHDLDQMDNLEQRNLCPHDR
jgi:hypothetical protein